MLYTRNTTIARTKPWLSLALVAMLGLFSPGNLVFPVSAVAQVSTAISGVVRDGNNDPLANTVVSLGGLQSGTTTTGASGQFSFTNLAAGLYTVTPQSADLIAPTGEQLAENPTVKAALDKAFNDSGFRTGKVHEEGGWIYMDGSGNIKVERAGPERVGLRNVNLNNAPSYNGYILVGDFHTHPYQKGDPLPNNPKQKITVEQRNPSPEDKQGNNLGGVPGLIRSPHGIKPYGPERRGSNPELAGTPNNNYGAYPGNTADASGSFSNRLASRRRN